MPTLTKKIEIKIDGELYDDYNFFNIELTQELLKPNEFRFTMQKKDLFKSKGDIEFDIPKKIIGAKVRCWIETIRYDESIETKSEPFVFDGIIFKVDLSRSDMISEILIDVVAYSSDYILMSKVNCRSFLNADLNNICWSILMNDTQSDMNLGNCLISPKFSEKIPYAVQYNESSYEYLTRLAMRYGEWFYSNGDLMVFGEVVKMDMGELIPRTDILSYKYSSDIKCVDGFRHVLSDYINNKTNELDSDSLDENNDSQYKNFLEFSDVIKEKSKKIYTPKEKKGIQHIQSGIIEDNNADELNTTMKSQILREKAGMIICSGTSVRADMILGSTFIIKDMYDAGGIKSDYSSHDKLLVCKLTHKVDVNGHYENKFSAISAESEFPPYYNSDIYPVSGSQQGFVFDNKDPMKMGRVKVKLEWQDPDNDEETTPWIRIAQPHGGGGKGFYFIPEINETVMVGLEKGNAEKPYVIGTLYNGKALPGNGWANSSNSYKAIRTRSHTIEIHDGSDGGEILIYDKKKDDSFIYRVTFSAKKKIIKLESKGDIELYADEDIIMHAKKYIRMHAKENITIDALKDIHVTAGDKPENNTNRGPIFYNINRGGNIYIDSEKSLGISSCDTVTEANTRESKIKKSDTLSAESLKINSKSMKVNSSEEIGFKSGKARVDIVPETIGITAGDVIIN